MSVIGPRHIMIDKDEMFPPILKASPSFTPLWEEFLEEWKDENDLPLYLVLGELSRHIASLVEARKVDELKEIFLIVEHWHIEGSAYVKEAATVGLLEELQGENNAVSIEAYLLTESKRWWLKVNEFWDSGKLIRE